MKIKTGDQVLITAGKDSGTVAKVIKALPQEMKIIVEGVNMRKKHMRPKREGEKGQMATSPAAFDVSNVKVICSKCGKATRVGYSIEGDTKKRICKKCQQEI